MQVNAGPLEVCRVTMAHIQLSHMLVGVFGRQYDKIQQGTRR
jgi:hypothetical protein